MNRKTVIFASSSTVGVALLWFLAVDWSWFVEECPDCGYMGDVVQYRLLAIPIAQEIDEYPSIVQRIAEDLGVGCTHPQLERWHKHRRWGLCYCKSPCINGVYRLSGDDSWYTEDVSEKIQSLVQDDPSIGSEFAERVLTNHEYSFIRTVVLVRAGVER